MGRFVWSLHVRADDAERVVRVVVDALTDKGYGALPLDSDATASPAPDRTVDVCNAINGWVSLFDSDPGAAIALTGELARRLQTWAMFVFANGDHYWGYVLHDRHGPADEFSSDGAADGYEIGELSPELSRLFAAGTVDDLRREIERRTAEFQDRLAELIPPHIHELHDRVQSGTATPEEAAAYDDWARNEMPKLADEMLHLSADVFEATESGASGEGGEEIDASPHVQRLGPLFVAGATDELAARILEGRTGEGGLGEFLPLIGIAPDFASLEAKDLTEPPSDGESDQAAIHLHARLNFQKVK